MKVLAKINVFKAISLGALALTLFFIPLLVWAGGWDVTLMSFIIPETIEDLILVILNVFIIIATPIVVLFIIIAGFRYVTARGNAEETKSATRALTYAIIGGIIIIGALAIAEMIKNIIEAFQ